MALVKSTSLLRSQSGQATLEYILILSIVVLGVITVFRGLERLDLQSKLRKPIAGEFARAYRYGHPRAKGYEDGNEYNSGGPEMHPRVSAEGNFRVFFNPR